MTDPVEIEFRSAGARLTGYEWAPSGLRANAVSVVMCHGLTNHHEDAPMFSVLRDRFLKAGLGVFMFDFIGSGKSEGLFQDKTWSGMRRNLADALDFVSEKIASPE